MVNGLIIVSPDSNEKIFEGDVLSPGEHGKKIFQYICENDLYFEGCGQETGYTLACYLAKLNYLVDTIENNKHYVYLGEKIYDAQEQWFRSNKKKLRNTSGVIEVLENCVNHYDLYTLEDGVKPYHVLRNFIDERRVGEKYVSNVRN